jgi:CheY-like chemotaxis protein
MGAVAASQHLPGAEPSTTRPRVRSRKSILLVDDQQAVRDAISLLLSLDQYTVVGAASGAEALALFKPRLFCLVITDFEMPEMKGDELAARIKQIWPRQPILMISAYEERFRDSRRLFDALLAKPFHVEDLRQTLARLIP